MWPWFCFQKKKLFLFMANGTLVTEYFQPLILSELRAILWDYSQCSKNFLLLMPHKLLSQVCLLCPIPSFVTLLYSFQIFHERKFREVIPTVVKESLLFSPSRCATGSIPVLYQLLLSGLQCRQVPCLPMSLLPITIFRQIFILFIVLSFESLLISWIQHAWFSTPAPLAALG